MLMKQVKLQTEKMLFEIDESVSNWITFNQPEKRNAISLRCGLIKGLLAPPAIASALELAMMNDEIKVVVLKGAGGQALCLAPISRSSIRNSFLRSKANWRMSYAEIGRVCKANELREVLLRQSSKPVIALIEGLEGLALIGIGYRGGRCNRFLQAMMLRIKCDLLRARDRRLVFLQPDSDWDTSTKG